MQIFGSDERAKDMLMSKKDREERRLQVIALEARLRKL
jgi:hypothetical protein